MFRGVKITVGITGGIAAYKAADLVSWLSQNGAEVRVAMTKSACEIITPLTIKTLSRYPVATDIMDAGAAWHVPHIDLAACDLLLLIPATANIMAKAAHGIADEIVSAILLATKAPILCAPAMHTDMYENPATQENMAILKARGWQMIEPDAGHLACGAVGKGRLADLDSIKDAISAFLAGKQKLAGKKVIVTAGPTYEYIDPIRFIGNRSSGKMGYAIAAAAKAAGAEVVLVSGPTALSDPPGIKVKRVVSAAEMAAAIAADYADTDIVIMTAAVADYCPEQTATEKIKKNEQQLSLTLKRTPDILSQLGKDKGSRILVGFAAETTNVDEYATRKLQEKNLDLIIANDISEEGAGFDVDTNIITAISAQKIQKYALMSKTEAAKEIIELISQFI